eukprot:8838043-Pyramimonas_sp.AAC.1
MMHREEHRGQFWNATEDKGEQLSRVPDPLRPLASLPWAIWGPVGPGGARRAARFFGEVTVTAAGVEQRPPRLPVSLPPGAVLGSTRLLKVRERRLTRPTQIALSTITMSSKSSGSERPVCKRPTLRRVYCKARASFIEDGLFAQVSQRVAATLAPPPRAGP